MVLKRAKKFLDGGTKKNSLLMDPKSTKRFHYGGTEKAPWWWYQKGSTMVVPKSFHYGGTKKIPDDGTKKYKNFLKETFKDLQNLFWLLSLRNHF